MQQEVCEVLPAVFSERDIKAKRGFTLSHVDPDKKIAYSERRRSRAFDNLNEHTSYNSGRSHSYRI